MVSSLNLAVETVKAHRAHVHRLAARAHRVLTSPSRQPEHTVPADDERERLGQFLG